MTDTRDWDKEILALQTIVTALSGLDDDERMRVLRWLNAKFSKVESKS